uniref:Uncharacterized protein n=1 Tax=Schizaphis graminum TaxID=13262 RepID=A0A2S2PAE1_SCHGA
MYYIFITTIVFVFVTQNAAGRLARLVDAIKAAIWRKAAGVSAISNSSGSLSGNGGSPGASTANRGSRDAAADLQNDDGLDLDPLDEAASASSTKLNASGSGAGVTGTAAAGGGNK